MAGTAETSGTPAVRLLVVEDEPDVRLLLSTYIALDDRIEICGEADNGEDALRLAEEIRFDAMILDLNLPVVDGLTLLPRLRTRFPGLGIVVYSAYVASVLTERTVLRLGADAVAPKWMPLSELKETILTAVAARRTEAASRLT